MSDVGEALKALEHVAHNEVSLRGGNLNLASLLVLAVAAVAEGPFNFLRALFWGLTDIVHHWLDNRAEIAARKAGATHEPWERREYPEGGPTTTKRLVIVAVAAVACPIGMEIVLRYH